MVSEEVKPIRSREFNQEWPRMPDEIERGGNARRPAHFAHLYEFVGDIEAPLNVEWKAMKDG